MSAPPHTKQAQRAAQRLQHGFVWVIIACLIMLIAAAFSLRDIGEDYLKNKIAQSFSQAGNGAIWIQSLELKPGWKRWDMVIPKLSLWPSILQKPLKLNDVRFSVPSDAALKRPHPSEVQAQLQPGVIALKQGSHKEQWWMKVLTQPHNIARVLQSTKRVLSALAQFRHLQVQMRDQTLLLPLLSLHCQALELNKPSLNRLQLTGDCEEHAGLDLAIDWHEDRTSVQFNVHQAPVHALKSSGHAEPDPSAARQDFSAFAQSIAWDLELREDQLSGKFQLEYAQLCASCELIEQMTLPFVIRSSSGSAPDDWEIVLSAGDLKLKNRQMDLPKLQWSGNIEQVVVLAQDFELGEMRSLWTQVLGFGGDVFSMLRLIQAQVQSASLQIPLRSEKKNKQPVLDWGRAALQLQATQLAVNSPRFSIDADASTVTVQGSPFAPKLSWQGSGATLFLKDLYTQAFQFDALEVNLNMYQSGSLRVMDFTHVNYRRRDHGLIGNLKGSMVLLDAPVNDQNRLDLVALDFGIEQMDLKHAARYLPDRSMNSEVLQWMRDSLHGGRFKDLVLSLRYHPNAPENQGFEQLELQAKVENGIIRAQGDWPEIRLDTARMAMNQQRLDMSHIQASYLGLRTAEASLSIEDLSREPTLQMAFKAQGDLADIHDFSLKAPFFEEYQQALRDYQPSGRSDLDMSVTIALSRDDASLVDGALSCERCTVGLPWDLKVENVSGRVRFNESYFESEPMTAQIMGGGYTAQVYSRHTEEGMLQGIDFQGEATRALAQFLLPQMVADNLYGSTHIQGRLRLIDSDLLFDAQSDMVGMGWNIPAPFTKQPSQVLPLEVNGLWEDSEPDMELGFSLGADIRGELYFYEHESNELQLRSGNVAFGVQPEKWIQPEKGLMLSGNFAELNWTKWLDWYAVQGDCEPTDYDLHIQTYFATAQYQGVDIGRGMLESHTVGLKQQTQVSMDHAQGVLWTQCVSGMTHFEADMDWVDLEPILSLRDQEDTTPTQESEWKLSDFNPGTLLIKQLRYQNQDYGSMKLKLSRMQQAGDVQKLIVHDLRISGPSLSTEIKGLWTSMAERDEVQFVMKTELHQMSALQKRIPGLKQLPSDRGQLSANLKWNGTPWNPDPATLTGTLSMNLRDGSIIGLNKGIGSQLLSFLNLIELVRILSAPPGEQLNQQHFNRLDVAVKAHQGRAEIESAHVSTNLFMLDAGGSVDLVQDTVDAWIHVTPEVASTLYSLVFWLNPQALLSAFILDPLWDGWGNALVFEYDVTGSLEAPKFVRIGNKTSESRAGEITE